MEDLKEAEDKYFFIKFAILTSDEDVAFFRTRIALMYAAYNRTQSPIERFVPIGQFVAGKSKDTLVLIAPVDHLYWTEDMARIVESINEKSKMIKGVNKRQLWLSGTVSPLSRKQLISQGWKIFEKSDDKLLSAIKKESKK